MAANNWLGAAEAFKDKWTVTISGTWSGGDTATITINGKTLVITVGTLTTTAQVAQTLYEAWNSASSFTDTTASVAPVTGGLGIPEAREYVATVSGSTVILTSTVAGRPGPTITAGDTAASGTCSISHTTTGTGPNSWDNTANWSAGTLPATGEDVTIDRPVSILYGLDQSGAAQTLLTLTITARFDSTCYLGLPSRNILGFEEFRQTELKGIGVTTFKSYSGSGMIKINFGTVQTAATIYSTGTSVDTGRSACQLYGTHVSNVLNVLSTSLNGNTNDVGWGSNNETATVATITQTNGTLTVGTGTTLTTYTNNGGTSAIFCAGTTCTSSSGSVSMFAGAWTTVTINGGYLYDFGTSTYTTVNLNNDATYDADGATGAKTITTLNLNDASTIIDTAHRLTLTNAPGWRGRLTASAS